ncbi:cache domain-containing sensor histidine kinase [Lachnoclostridium phytofermentans]|uniref:Histidine kinase internal region n=1 Tax=Lachnoclostridium phytofermentans (strain ATCC 700394 / DSM 18823 / ISDg) TaxID=357809 RepID=A9KI79_LACP7|nr:histidine kinase [Lachnoclostridium phytofermentans]ABX40913.1 histidine kinase internal region [Lachnoclostridium phytofermentans ISDg]
MERFKLSNISIYKKLLAAFVIIIILPQITSYLIAEQSSKNLIVGQLSSETMSSLQMASDNINTLLKRMTSIALFVNSDKNIKGLIEDETTADNLKNLDRINKFNSFIENIAYNMMGTRCYITVITKSGNRYTNWNSSGPSSSAFLEKYTPANLQNKSPGFIWSFLDENYIDSDKKAYPYILTLVKNIYDNSGKKLYGTFIISIPEIELSNLTVSSSEQPKTQRAVIDKNNIVISSNQKEWIGKPLSDIISTNIPEEPKGYFITKGDSENIISYSHLDSMTIIDVKSYDSITKQLRVTTNRLLLFNFFFILLYLFISALIAKNLVNPIHRLSKKMLDTNFESPIEEPPKKRMDEIGILENTFYIMRENIYKLIQDNQEKEKKKRESDMKFLQSQISPHFLFNTLNTIRWAGINNNNQKVADMVLALSNLLRMTIVKENDLITISEEINTLRSYALIIQMRHSTQFELICNLPEELLTYHIPKLLLQPIVENSIIHGFENIDSEGIIEISSRTEDQFMILSIIDNGAGMDLNSFDGKNKKEFKFSGIGIKNIDERIKIYFGDKYGIKITSSINQGTTVELWLPSHDIYNDRKEESI